jgi:hypothetical protein
MSRTRSRSRRSVACSRAERDDLGVLLGEEVLDVGHRALLPACLHSCVTAVTVVVARMADDARGVEAARARERRAQHRLQLRRANRLSNIQLFCIHRTDDVRWRTSRGNRRRQAWTLSAI